MPQAINSVLTYMVVDFLSIAFSFLIIKKLTTDIGSELEIRILKTMLQIFIAYSFIDAAWILGEYGYMPYFLRFVNGAVCFLSIFLVGVLGFLTLIYTEIRLKTLFVKKRELWIIASVPLVLSFFMCICSYRTGWIFYITSDNRYVRGPYYCWQMTIVLLYFASAAFRACGTDRKNKCRCGKKLRSASPFPSLPPLPSVRFRFSFRALRSSKWPYFQAFSLRLLIFSRRRFSAMRRSVS